MDKIKILITDDEAPARKKIAALLKEESSAGLILEAGDGREAVEIIQEEMPDLVFLDIQMPEMDGFEVIKTVGVENMPAVIFVTAYDQYAIDAFEVQAVDYLLKPFDQERFRRSYKRALENIQEAGTASKSLEGLLSRIGAGKKHLERFIVKRGDRYFFIKADDVLHITSEEKYVRLHTAEKSHLIRETMNSLEERLNPDKFVRIHRSTIVHVDAIKEIQPWSHGDSIVILTNGDKLPLSRRYRSRLFEREE